MPESPPPPTPSPFTGDSSSWDRLRVPLALSSLSHQTSDLPYYSLLSGAPPPNTPLRPENLSFWRGPDLSSSFHFSSLHLFFFAPTTCWSTPYWLSAGGSISKQRTEHSPNKDKTRHYHLETPQSCSFQMPRPQGKNTNRSSQDKMPPPEASNPVTASPERCNRTRAQGEDSKIAILNMFINLKRIWMNHLVMTEKT